MCIYQFIRTLPIPLLGVVMWF
uniref:Uncharacterized protein n=1 Tax=Rhizophora mucronata TaxID=61149 RepID=A0A2P2IIB8_RHIMU